MSAFLALVAAAAVTAAVACTATSDPRAGKATGTGGSGSGRPSGSSGGPTGSSGGIDAAPPEGAVDCGPAPGAPAPFTKQALLGAAAECAAWHACGFQNAATALRTTFRAHAAAPSDATRSAAQAAWRAAMNEQSKMELFQFGPVGSKTVDKYHGRGLRSFVHPWPDLNRCQIETQVVTKAYAGGWDVVFPSSRGLYAVEYALFHPGSDTVCLSNSTAAQTWATQTPEQLTAAKNEYGTAVVDNLVALALEIRNVWAADGEGFKAKLLAFEGYGSEQETLNVVAWSLFYPEDSVKDLKLGSLAGFQTAPYTSETPFAHVEVENVRTNLRAFRSLFEGCGADGAGVGFDDWLVAAGQGQLAQDMLAALAKAQAAADAFPSFGQASTAQFVGFYEAIKPLTDLLKTSFFGSASPLNLKLPASAASDTD
jgi:predicted lipoprotein